VLPLIFKFVVVVLVAFIVELSCNNLRVESVSLFVVEFYVSVDDVPLVLLVLLSVVVLSEVELLALTSSV
jgi:hypothetical protein